VPKQMLRERGDNDRQAIVPGRRSGDQATSALIASPSMKSGDQDIRPPLMATNGFGVSAQYAQGPAGALTTVPMRTERAVKV
jgi:hypothetical protein